MPETLEQVQQKVLTDPLYQRAFLRERSKRDFSYFCRNILGYHDLNKEHEALCEFLQHESAKTKLILMPRYTFKSSVVTIGDSLWRLLNNPNERLLIYSDAATKSEGFLTGIKNHILGQIHGSLFRAVCGEWEVDPKRGVWNQSAIVIATRTQAHAEASIETAGLETSKVGKHYSRMKFDDLVSDVNVTTKDLMDKVEACYQKAGSLLMPSGSTDITGTRWHYGDLYGRLIAELKGQKDFAIFHRKAHEGERYFFTDIGKDSLTPEFLAKKKASQGSRIYSALYQNEPTDDETAVFKVADFRFYEPKSDQAYRDWVNSLYITAVLDAIPPPKDDHGDDAAITVCGTDAEHNLYLLEAAAGRWMPEEQITRLLQLHDKWHFRTVGLETNAFQLMIKEMLELRIASLRKHPAWRPFSLVEFTGRTQGNKESRILGLQPYHERGALRLPGSSIERLSGVYSQLAYQMMQFPHSQKDDVLDSLAYHIQIHQAGYEKPQAVTYPVTSAAWFERELQKEAVQTMARRPRWTRRPVPELSFS